MEHIIIAPVDAQAWRRSHKLYNAYCKRRRAWRLSGAGATLFAIGALSIIYATVYIGV